jgi:hypothetical protein
MNDLEDAIHEWFAPLLDDAVAHVQNRIGAGPSSSEAADAHHAPRPRRRAVIVVPALAAAVFVVILVGLPTLFLLRPTHSSPGLATAVGPTPHPLAATPQVPDGSPLCEPGQLAVSIGNVLPAGEFLQVEVNLTNTSSSRCHISRDVRLAGIAEVAPSIPSYWTTVTLEPGQKGTIVLQNSKCESGRPAEARRDLKVVVDGSDSYSVKLPQSLVAGATCPVYVSPLMTTTGRRTLSQKP